MLDDAELLEVLDLFFDSVCERRVSDFVDPTRVLPLVDIVLREPNIRFVQRTVLAPARQRAVERLSKSTLPLSRWLRSEDVDALAQALGAPVRIPRRWIDDAVASEQVRDSVRTMLSDTLTNFLKGGESGGGLGAAVGWGARAMGAAGRGLFGGIGETIQKQMQDRVRDFVDGSVAMMQKRIADKLASDDTAKQIGNRRRGAFQTLMKKTEADVANASRRVPWEAVDETAARTIVHNVLRDEVRTAVGDEAAASVAALSERTIGEWLKELGLHEMARDIVRTQGLPIARAVSKSERFTAWWNKARAGQ